MGSHCFIAEAVTLSFHDTEVDIIEAMFRKCVPSSSGSHEIQQLVSVFGTESKDHIDTTFA